MQDQSTELSSLVDRLPEHTRAGARRLLNRDSDTRHAAATLCWFMTLDPLDQFCNEDKRGRVLPLEVHRHTALVDFVLLDLIDDPVAHDHRSLPTLMEELRRHAQPSSVPELPALVRRLRTLFFGADLN